MRRPSNRVDSHMPSNYRILSLFDSESLVPAQGRRPYLLSQDALPMPRSLSHPDFLKGRLHTDFIDSHGLSGTQPEEFSAEPAVAAAVEYFLRNPKKGEVRRPQRNLWKESARRYWE